MSSSTPLPPTKITPLPAFQPDLYERAWCSIPHPTLPLLATAHAKSVTIFNLATLSSHSSLSGGHSRSVRSVAWKPNLGPRKLCLVTGSFDSTAGLWRWDRALPFAAEEDEEDEVLEREVTAPKRNAARDDDSDEDGAGVDDWEFTLVLEGHDSEVKNVAFSPSGAFLATCSRDKSVWIWEDVGSSEGDDEWETVSVLNEHDADVKAVAWCPDVPGRSASGKYSADVLASASYDDTVRIWREDNDGEWVCVAVLEGHQGTVWGIEWETRPREDGAFPRLLTYSADQTIRVWKLKEDDEGDDASGGGFARAGLGGIPNTMRRSVREEWVCEAILPKAHTRDIYSAAWSPQSGLVASTGSDGLLVLYGEDESSNTDIEMRDPSPAQTDEATTSEPTQEKALPGPGKWEVLATMENAHGAYEINHVTWCRRFDDGCERKGEEMLVSTGDDGLVRPWKIE